MLQIDTKGKRLILSEQMFAPDELRRAMCEVMFEEYDFGSLFAAPPALLASYARRARARSTHDAFSAQSCGIVVDVGYSATHVVPIFDGRVLNYAVRRIDVGVKAIVNYMKELISFRHFDVQEETHLVTDIVEQLCFVSRDFVGDMQRAARARNHAPLRQVKI